MEMKRVFCLVFNLFLGIFLFSCSGNNQSAENISDSLSHCAPTADGSTRLIEQSFANQKTIELLQFPQTIISISLSEPQKEPHKPSLVKIPADMILVPAGNVHMGNSGGFAHELPRFWAKVSSFLMDKSPVTVSQFRKFIQATAYKTEAEKFGNAGVISDDTEKQWTLVDGATWEYPQGKTKPRAPDNHPVTQVSWNDANAYAKWAGKRLPCEIEWEHAARNAQNDQTKFPWGDDIQENEKYKANVWQGKFPIKNNNTDTYAYTSPVGIFGKTPLGLTDMTGNVWEWMSNRKFDYASLFVKDVSKVVISEEYAERGGSFLCEPSWCEGYRVSGRSSSSAETSLFHVGFRCIKDVE